VTGTKQVRSRKMFLGRPVEMRFRICGGFRNVPKIPVARWQRRKLGDDHFGPCHVGRIVDARFDSEILVIFVIYENAEKAFIPCIVHK